jgi:hypothetical protein
MPDPTRIHSLTPPATTTPPATDPGKDRQNPARQVQEGGFDDSAAGEEDPGAGVDTLTPKH